MGQPAPNTLERFRSASQDLEEARRRQQEIPDMVSAASQSRQEATTALLTEVINHPEMSGPVKAAWVIGIDLPSHRFNNYQAMPVEERVGFFAQALEDVDEGLRKPGELVVRTASRFELQRRSWQPAGRDNPRQPATNFFRMGASYGGGLEVGLQGRLRLSIGVESESTPSTHDSSPLNTWNVSPYELVALSHTSPQTITDTVPAELYHNYGFHADMDPECLVLVGEDTVTAYLEGMIEYKKELQESDSDGSFKSYYTGVLQEVALSMWQQAKGLGFNLEQNSPALDELLKTVRTERLEELAHAVGKKVIERFGYGSPPEVKLTDMDTDMGIDTESVKQAASDHLDKKVAEMRAYLGRLERAEQQ